MLSFWALRLRCSIFLSRPTLPRSYEAGRAHGPSRKYCGHVEPRLGPLRACFESHIDNLSGPCASRMAQVTNAARECEADVKRLCGGVKRAKEIEECMTPRLGGGQQGVQGGAGEGRRPV